MSVVGGMGVEGTVGGFKGHHEVRGLDGSRPQDRQGKLRVEEIFR